MKEERREMGKQDVTTKQVNVHHLTDLLDMGWWEADLEENVFCCSDYIAGLLELGGKSVNIEYFYKMIREDYRARVIASIFSAIKTRTSQQIFPVYVENKTMWVAARFKRSEEEHKIVGMMHTVDDQESHIPEMACHGTMKNLIYQLNGIAASLLAFMKSENLDDMINHILTSLVTYYSAERAYIFEYYWDKGTQSCTHEVVSRPGLEEIQNLTDMPCDANTWWNQQVLSQHPIVLNTLDDLPEWDAYDREVLASQDIKSLMVVPFINQDDTVWGYAGIDIVDRQRNWTDEDFQWFSSLMHIINISIELNKSKIQIQEDKEYLQSLYKYMPIGYLSSKLIYDENGVPADFVFTEANKEIERITELPASLIVGSKGSQLPVFRDFQLMTEVVNSKKQVGFDMALDPFNKYCKSIQFSLRKDEVISLVMDVTDTYNAHKALEENEKLLRTIYANLPVGIELCDKTGVLVQTNEKASEIMRSESMFDGEWNVFENPLIPADIKRKVKRGETVDFSLIYDLNKIRDLRGLSKLEKPVQNLTVKVVPIFDDYQNILYHLSLIINNTETTNAYLKIQEFEEYFSLIANLAKVGYFKWNLTTNEGFGISQWFINLGLPAGSQMTEDLHGMYGNLYPEDFNAITEFYEAAVTGEAHSFERELRVLDEEGHIQWLRCTLIARKEKVSEGIELIGVSYDITELKEMILAKDKAEALDRLKSAFLANMSHEIRTPLNSIIGFSDLLAETSDEDERQEFIAIIQRNNELLLKLVSDILDLSKIESGTFDFVRRKINVNTICGEVIQAFRNKELPEGVELMFDHSFLPEEIMYADPGRVKQVLMNFITNSFKFTHKGYIKLGYEPQPDDTMLFFVEDTGTGIAPENMEKIFDRFVKLDSFVQGTGLGLSICKSLIEEMGGTIGVKSEVDKGSCFWFTLPVLPDKLLPSLEFEQADHHPDNSGD